MSREGAPTKAPAPPTIFSFRSTEPGDPSALDETGGEHELIQICTISNPILLYSTLYSASSPSNWNTSLLSSKRPFEPKRNAVSVRPPTLRQRSRGSPPRARRRACIDIPLPLPPPARDKHKHDVTRPPSNRRPDRLPLRPPTPPSREREGKCGSPRPLRPLDRGHAPTWLRPHEPSPARVRVAAGTRAVSARLCTECIDDAEKARGCRGRRDEIGVYRAV